MRHFHKAGEEKRTPVIIKPEQYSRWLGSDVPTAEEMMTWVNMPALQASAQPRVL
jgi:putative SOS response-associated peptidase YedK